MNPVFDVAGIVAQRLATVVEGELEVVLEGLNVGSDALGEDVDFVLDGGTFAAHALGSRVAVGADFGAEFVAGGAEEVGCLWKVRGGCFDVVGMMRMVERTISASLLFMIPALASSMLSARIPRTAFIVVTAC